MMNFDWLLRSVDEKMNVSQNFWDNPRIYFGHCLFYSNAGKQMPNSIKVSSFEISEIIHKKEGGPYCAISDTDTSVTLIKLATKTSKIYCNFQNFIDSRLFQRRIQCKNWVRTAKCCLEYGSKHKTNF